MRKFFTPKHFLRKQTKSNPKAETITPTNSTVIQSISVIGNNSFVILSRLYSPMLLSLSPMEDDADPSKTTRRQTNILGIIVATLQALYPLHIFDGIGFVNEFPIAYKLNEDCSTTRFTCDLAYI